MCRRASSPTKSRVVRKLGNLGYPPHARPSSDVTFAVPALTQRTQLQYHVTRPHAQSRLVILSRSRPARAFSHVTWLEEQAFPVIHCRSQAFDWTDHLLWERRKGPCGRPITTTPADAGDAPMRSCLLAPWTCVHRPARLWRLEARAH
jgi:hypothetical protein